MVRFADDFVMGFSRREDAERVLAVLPKRFAKYGLKLHPEKTRLVRFVRPRKGRPPPGTFDFLGFTHHWGPSRKGKPALKRKTAKSRLNRTLKGFNEWMRRCRHIPVPAQRQILNGKLWGHYAYFGITGNSAALWAVWERVRQLWRKWLSRRSPRGYLSWDTYVSLLERHPLVRPVAMHSTYR